MQLNFERESVREKVSFFFFSFVEGKFWIQQLELNAAFVAYAMLCPGETLH